MPATLQTKESTPRATDLARSAPTKPLPGQDPCRLRVLMISFAFPPTGGVGVQRSAKFAKYLPHFGWQPVVWSASYLKQLPYDKSLLADLPPDLPQYHSRPMSYASVHERLMNILRKFGLTARQGSRDLSGIDWRLEQLLHRLAKRLIPDDYIVWALYSLPFLLRLVRKERIDVVYSTYSPISSHLLGDWLKRLTGLPWVADYRDLWIDDYCHPTHSWFRRRIEHRLQRKLVEQADAVIATGQGQAAVLESYAPSQGKKFFVIPNGVDPEDFAHLDRVAIHRRLHGPMDRFVLTFAGQFTSRRTSAALFEALGEFSRWTAKQDEHFELRLVGGVSTEMGERFKAHQIPAVFTGYLPHNLAIEQMIGADVLLLLAPTGINAHTFALGKLFEYLASGHPILLVGPEGVVAGQIINSFQAGVCVTHNRKEVLEALKHLWGQWKKGELDGGCPRKRMEQYSRKHQTRMLAGILDRVKGFEPSETRRLKSGAEFG